MISNAYNFVYQKQKMLVIPLFYCFIFSSTLLNRVESGPINYDDSILDSLMHELESQFYYPLRPSNGMDWIHLYSFV